MADFLNFNGLARYDQKIKEVINKSGIQDVSVELDNSNNKVTLLLKDKEGEIKHRMTIHAATDSNPGLMSSTDKRTLDGLSKQKLFTIVLADEYGLPNVESNNRRTDTIYIVRTSEGIKQFIWTKVETMPGVDDYIWEEIGSVDVEINNNFSNGSVSSDTYFNGTTIVTGDGTDDSPFKVNVNIDDSVIDFIDSILGGNIIKNGGLGFEYKGSFDYTLQDILNLFSNINYYYVFDFGGDTSGNLPNPQEALEKCEYLSNWSEDGNHKPYFRILWDTDYIGTGVTKEEGGKYSINGIAFYQINKKWGFKSLQILLDNNGIIEDVSQDLNALTFEFNPNNDGSKYLNNKGKYEDPGSYIMLYHDNPEDTTHSKEVLTDLPDFNSVDGKTFLNVGGAFVDTVKPPLEHADMTPHQIIQSHGEIFYKTNDKYSRLLKYENIQGYKQVSKEDLDTTIEPYVCCEEVVPEESILDWVVRTITNLHAPAAAPDTYMRYQIAYGFEIGKEPIIYTRFHDDTVWSSWKKLLQDVNEVIIDDYVDINNSNKQYLLNVLDFEGDNILFRLNNEDLSGGYDMLIHNIYEGDKGLNIGAQIAYPAMGNSMNVLYRTNFDIWDEGWRQLANYKDLKPIYNLLNIKKVFGSNIFTEDEGELNNENSIGILKKFLDRYKTDLSYICFDKTVYPAVYYKETKTYGEDTITLYKLTARINSNHNSTDVLILTFEDNPETSSSIHYTVRIGGITQYDTENLVAISNSEIDALFE